MIAPHALRPEIRPHRHRTIATQVGQHTTSAAGPGRTTDTTASNDRAGSLAHS